MRRELYVPASTRTCPPGVSRGLLVTTCTSPPTALAPHNEEAGPRTTSTRSTSSMSVGANSHITNPRKSWYNERPSATARVVLLIPPVAEREAMFTSRALNCTTLIPGMRRSWSTK